MRAKVETAPVEKPRRKAAVPKAPPGRLPYITENRFAGFEVVNGIVNPVIKVMLIGHGQQLARQRLGDRLQQPTEADTRQTRRRAAFKAAKEAERAARHSAAAAELGRIRGYRTTVQP